MSSPPCIDVVRTVVSKLKDSSGKEVLQRRHVFYDRNLLFAVAILMLALRFMPVDSYSTATLGCCKYNIAPTRLWIHWLGLEIASPALQHGALA